MDADLQQLLTDLTSLFGVFAVLAVFCAGFFLGLRWLRKLADDEGPADYVTGNPRRDYAAYKAYRADGWSPREISQGGKYIGD